MIKTLIEHKIHPDNSILRLKKEIITDDNGQVIDSNIHARRIRPVDDYFSEDQETIDFCDLVFTEQIRRNFVEYKNCEKPQKKQSWMKNKFFNI